MGSIAIDPPELDRADPDFLRIRNTMNPTTAKIRAKPRMPPAMPAISATGTSSFFALEPGKKLALESESLLVSDSVSVLIGDSNGGCGDGDVSGAVPRLVEMSPLLVLVLLVLLVMLGVVVVDVVVVGRGVVGAAGRGVHVRKLHVQTAADDDAQSMQFVSLACCKMQSLVLREFGSAGIPPDIKLLKT